jgi:hypothetical protein
LAAYGWQDLRLDHAAQGTRHTISEATRREILTRLLKLDHERYAEEVRLGLHEKKAVGKAKAAKGRGKRADGQMSLL